MNENRKEDQAKATQDIQPTEDTPAPTPHHLEKLETKRKGIDTNDGFPAQQVSKKFKTLKSPQDLEKVIINNIIKTLHYSEEYKGWINKIGLKNKLQKYGINETNIDV